MKVLIFYFSGTGNTKMILDEYVRHFEESGHSVEVRNIDEFYNKKIEDDLNRFNKIGLFYPIHAFNAPANVLAFAKKIEKLESKKPLFIVKTSGEPLALNNISSLKVKSILKKRGIILENEYHYCMPYNIIFRHTDNMAYKMWESAKKIIPYDCDEIIAGQKRKLKYIPCGRFIAWLFRIEHWAGRFNGKKYKVNENCVKCGLCVRRCPTHNITIENGEFKFGKNCLMCMRCSFHCPKNAIKIGMFESWKVNGAYTFAPKEGEEERHKKYCKKSYIKYFDRIEKRVNNE